MVAVNDIELKWQFVLCLSNHFYPPLVISNTFQYYEHKIINSALLGCFLQQSGFAWMGENAKSYEANG